MNNGGRIREGFMKKLKKMFRDLFADGDSLQTTLFNIIVGCAMAGGIISLIVTVIIGLEGTEILIIAAAELFLCISFYLANVKKKLNISVLIISVGVSAVLLPLLFFAGGGVNSGMPFWFVIGIVFEFLLAKGKTRIFFVIFDLAEYSLCFLIDYTMPQYVVRINSTRGVYLDKWQSMVLLAVLVGIVLCFQNRVHMRMHLRDLTQKRELDEARKEAEEAKEAYMRLAFSDTMTDLSNRTAFENHMEKIRSACLPPAKAVAAFPTIILIADLNYLKRINDRWGHGAGDAAIREAAELLKKEFGENSACYRIGGDEFCVISEAMPEGGFVRRFERFLRASSECKSTAGYRLSVAAGYAVVGKDGIDEAFRAADRNMYERKTEMKTAAD